MVGIMSKDLLYTVDKKCREIETELFNLHFKSLWKNHINDVIPYWDFKERVFEMVNIIREKLGSWKYSHEIFDNGWQYRIIGHEKYEIAKDEMINLVFGWW